MNRKGQSTIEFALTALLLLTILLSVAELAMMFYVNLTMQHAVRQGTRLAITGPPGDRRSQLVQKIKDSSNGLYDRNALPRKDPTVSGLTPAGKKGFDNYSVAETGKPGEIIIVSLTYAWPLLTPALKPAFSDGRYTFTVRATMRNELWGPE